MVFGDFSFEEVLLFFEVDGLGEPWEGVGGLPGEGLEVTVDEAAVGDVIDVLLEFFDGETDGAYGEAILNEVFLKADAFCHGLAEVLLELGSPDVRVLGDEGIEKITEDLDVIRLITKGVAEHLADTGELILTVEAEDHAEETVELGSFHDLAEEEDVLGESLLIFELAEIHIAAEAAGVADDEIILRLDGGNVLKHGLAVVRVEAEA